MKSKFGWILILLTLALIMPVYGCGGKAASPSATQTPINTYSQLTPSILQTTGPQLNTTTAAVTTSNNLTTTTASTTTTSPQSTTSNGPYEIRVYSGMLYVPDKLTVAVGSTVTFILVNGPDLDHPLGFDPPLDYILTSSGKDTLLSFTFTKPVTLHFFCAIHGVSGTVNVK